MYVTITMMTTLIPDSERFLQGLFIHCSWWHIPNKHPPLFLLLNKIFFSTTHFAPFFSSSTPNIPTLLSKHTYFFPTLSFDMNVFPILFFLDINSIFSFLSNSLPFSATHILLSKQPPNKHTTAHFPSISSSSFLTIIIPPDIRQYPFFH